MTDSSSHLVSNPRALDPKPNASDRAAWLEKRLAKEAQLVKTGRYGGKSRLYWWVRQGILKTTMLAIQLCGLSARGRRNAVAVMRKQQHVVLPRVPRRVKPLRILHLSDLHWDAMPEVVQRAQAQLSDQPVDICVWTGDYRDELTIDAVGTARAMRPLVDAIQTRYGHLAVLGNHDSAKLVPQLEKIGVQVLINESLNLQHQGSTWRIIGVDDPHFFCDEAVMAALSTEATEEAGTLLLAHSPEIYAEAAAANIDLYLCGHTHGGQICLPGGYAPVTTLRCGKGFYRGIWSYGDMVGFTHSGLGPSALPVRFNTRPEIVYLQVNGGA